MPGVHCRVLAAALAQELAVAVLRHPAGAGKMAIMNLLRPLGFGVGIDPEDDAGGFTPVGAIGRRVENAHVFLHMRAIVVG